MVPAVLERAFNAHPASTERRADDLHILPGLSGGVPQKGLAQSCKFCFGALTGGQGSAPIGDIDMPARHAYVSY
jgi:hypothetical protein